MNQPEEKKGTAQEASKQETQQKPERAPNWITDMYDKMNVPVKVLDAVLILLGVLIVLLFVFGNKIKLGI